MKTIGWHKNSLPLNVEICSIQGDLQQCREPFPKRNKEEISLGLEKASWEEKLWIHLCSYWAKDGDIIWLFCCFPGKRGPTCQQLPSKNSGTLTWEVIIQAIIPICLGFQFYLNRCLAVKSLGNIRRISQKWRVEKITCYILISYGWEKYLD